MLIFAKELHTPPSILENMYWYDVILMINRYNEIMEQSKSESTNYETDMMAKQSSYANQMQNIKVPSFNTSSFNSITSGIKMPSIK